MNLDLKRWALMAQEMQFHQLEAARKQAESWRTGLTALTALVGTALIVKGRDTFTGLTSPLRWLVVLLLASALVMLVLATMLVVRAVAGAPGDEIILSGEELRDWSADEVRRIASAIRWSTRLTLSGVCTLALAVGLTWLGPAKATDDPLIEVEYGHRAICGELAGADQGQLIIRNDGPKRVTVVPLATITDIEKVSRCPNK